METMHPIAVLADIMRFSFVKDISDVLACVTERLNAGDETFNRALKEDIVLPQRIVGINQDCLARHDNQGIQQRRLRFFRWSSGELFQNRQPHFLQFAKHGDVFLKLSIQA